MPFITAAGAFGLVMLGIIIIIIVRKNSKVTIDTGNDGAGILDGGDRAKRRVAGEQARWATTGSPSSVDCRGRKGRIDCSGYRPGQRRTALNGRGISRTRSE